MVAQRAIPASTPVLRGIRMDVEVEEWEGNLDVELPVMNIYDIEPHLSKEEFLPKRNRFYQAKIDSRYMKSGEIDFSKLPNLFVITILNYDPFGFDYMMYTVGNSCREVPEVAYDDGLQFVYFYTGGHKGGCEAIRNMLLYIQESKKDNVTDEATQEIHDYVSRVKIQPEKRLEYMKYEEIIAYARRDGALEIRRSAIIELLEDYGELPLDLQERIEQEKSMNVLKNWLKLAAKATDIQDFQEKIQ